MGRAEVIGYPIAWADPSFLARLVSSTTSTTGARIDSPVLLQYNELQHSQVR